MTVTAERPATWANVEAAQRGDMDAFGRIYQTYYDTVFRFIYYRVSNRQTAEDLTSTVFVRALASIGGLTWQGREVGAWLTVVARNLIADHRKRAEHRLTTSVPAVLDIDTVRLDPVPDTADVVTAGALAAIVRDAVSYLTDEQRTCIELRFFGGLSVAETAAVMGKREGTVKSLQYRAVVALRRLLDKAEVR